MKLLLETHTLLWWSGDSQRLSAKARRLLADRSNSLVVSAATAWEIANKHRVGKLPGVLLTLVQDMPGFFARQGLTELPISVAHAQLAGTLAGAHKDPFDRMLAAQSLFEGLPILGCDKALLEFGVKLVW